MLGDGWAVAAAYLAHKLIAGTRRLSPRQFSQYCAPATPRQAFGGHANASADAPTAGHARLSARTAADVLTSGRRRNGRSGPLPEAAKSTGAGAARVAVRRALRRRLRRGIHPLTERSLIDASSDEQLDSLRRGSPLFCRNQHFFKALSDDILPLGHDPIAERTGGGVRGLGSDTETIARSRGYIEGVVVFVLSDEHVVAATVNDRSEVIGELNLSLAINQMANAKVFEPALRALHAVKATVRSVGERDHRRFGTSDVESPVDLNSAVKKAGKPRTRPSPNGIGVAAIIGLPDDAVSVDVLGYSVNAAALLTAANSLHAVGIRGALSVYTHCS